MSEHQEETKPKAPKGLKEAIADQQATPPSGVRRVVWQEAPPKQVNCITSLMLLAALGGASCLCLLIITLSGVAGVQDELRAIKTQAAQTQVAGVATQYFLGNADLAAGNAELAQLRFEAIVATMPTHHDAATKLAEIQHYTPTLTPSLTPIPPTLTPVPTVDTELAPTENALNPAELYGRAESAMTLQDYEEAIKWLDALVLVDGNYRRSEVETMRMDALLTQALIYLRGRNEDGEDRLAQGVQLIYRADELGDVPGEVLYEADFVARYLAARAYVQAGAYDQARPVLTRLCEEDCDWSYRGQNSVRDLLSRAGG